MSDIALKQPGVERGGLPGPVDQRLHQQPERRHRVRHAEAVRRAQEQGAVGNAIAAELNKQYGAIQDAFIAMFPPPPVQGLGTIGGFKLQIEDRAALGYDALYNATNAFMAKARATPELAGMFTSYQVNVPQLDVTRPHQGQAAGRAGDRRVRHAADLPGLAVRERLQPFGRTYQVRCRPMRSSASTPRTSCS
jgi:multidrug efflux pump